MITIDGRLPWVSWLLVTAIVIQAQLALAQFPFSFYPGMPGMSGGQAATNRISKLEGATLQTAPEQELFKLRRAKEFADDGDFRSANALWQSVLDMAGAQLTTSDQWRFHSGSHEYVKFVTVASQIESILSKLSREGLAAYRLKADGEARALLLNPTRRTRTDVLSEVVRRYFLSSEGDEAAFELACLKMDSYDFNDASRLLRKCLEEHPECTVPRKEILLRLAVANARIGDSESSEKMVDQLASANGKDERIAMVQVSNLALRSASRTPSENWNLKYGDSPSFRTMKSLKEGYFEGELSETWSHPFDTFESPLIGNQNAIFGGGYGGGGYGGGDLVFLPGPVPVLSGGGAIPTYSTRAIATARQNRKDSTPPKIKSDLRHLLGRWKQNEWTCVGRLLLNEGLVYFKSGERVVCCSLETGESKWMGKINEFQVDAATAMSNMFQAPVISKTPKKLSEIQLFGDQVYHSMSIGDGHLYCIEGPTELDPRPTPTQPQSPFNFSTPSRGRRNWLVAYDAKGGELLWRRGGKEDRASESNFDIGFSSAPVSGGGLAFTTVNDNGSISLIAINPQNGSTVWKTYLCDEPIGRCSPWATNAIAYSGGDVYVGTGAGIIATVESVSGVVRWVVRYERMGVSNEIPSPFGIPMSTANVVGWREDIVVPTGRALLVMGSDSDVIFSLDRRSGELLWDSPRQLPNHEVENYLGLLGNRLYVSGKNSVRCYDVDLGNVVWDNEIVGQFGTGVVTEDAIYIPSGSEIVRLSLEDGRELARANLVTTTGEPVGNLFSDGQRLLGIGLARVYSLDHLKNRMDTLEMRVARGDVQGLLERMRLEAAWNHTDAACADLSEAYRIASKTKSGDGDEATATDQACLMAINAVQELNFATSATKFVLQLVNRMDADLSKFPTRTGAVADEIQSGLKGVVYAVFNVVTEQRQSGLTNEILAIVPRFDEESFFTKAWQAIEATCLPADYETFRTVLGADNEARRIVAVAGLVKSASADRIGQDLRSLIGGEKSDRVRLRLALAMANTNERQSLVVLGELLDSEDSKVRDASAKALASITEQNFGTVLESTTKDLALTKNWQDWITLNVATTKLILPYAEKRALRGRTLVCLTHAGRVVEYDGSGKQTWTMSVNSPFAVQGLSNGNRLVSSFSDKKVFEYDAAGKKLVWDLDIASGYPIRVYRLENGNTLVVTQNENQVLEYRADKSIAWQFTGSGTVSDAQRMPNGNTLVSVMEGQVLEVNPSGKVVWSTTSVPQPVCAQPLENGNILIALSGDGRVIEITKEHKEAWSRAGFEGITDTQRLPDGNTLIVDRKGVHLYTSKGEKIDAQVPLPKSNSAGTITELISGRATRIITSNPREAITRAHRY